MTESSRIK